MDQEERVNEHPACAPPLVSSSPGTTDMEGTTLGLTAVPKARGRRQGAVPQAWLPQHLFISLSALMLGRPSSLSDTLEQQGAEDGWTQVTGAQAVQL